MDFKLVILLLTVVFAIFPIVFFVVSKNEKHIRIVFLILAIFYSLIVCAGVFSNIQLGNYITILPFDNISHLNKTFNFDIVANDLQDFIINILMLVPFGFLLKPIFQKYSITKTLIIGIGFSVLIEILQLVLPINRSPQLSDIILNSLSCLIGILTFNLFKFIVMKLKSKKKKTI